MGIVDNIEKNTEIQDKPSFKLVILGDSITKRILPEVIMKCEEDRVCNLSHSGAKVRDIYRQVEDFKAQHNEAKVENIVIHVGTNHLEKEKPSDISRKIGKLLHRVKFEFKEAKVYFSSIVPKYDSSFFDSISHVNFNMMNVCAATNGMYFIFHNDFQFKRGLNESLYWIDKVHPNRKGLSQLALDYIDVLRYQKI